MDIQEMKLRGFVSFAMGVRDQSMIMVARDKKTDNFVVIAGKHIKRRWGIFNVPQGMWRVVCKKEEVREAVDRILTEKILARVGRVLLMQNQWICCIFSRHELVPSAHEK